MYGSSSELHRKRLLLERIEVGESKVQDIVAKDDSGERAALCDELYSDFGYFTSIEATSVLEMALWKAAIKAGNRRDGTKRQTLDRVHCRDVSVDPM